MSSISYAAIFKHYERDVCLTPNSMGHSLVTVSVLCIERWGGGYLYEGHAYDYSKEALIQR